MAMFEAELANLGSPEEKRIDDSQNPAAKHGLEEARPAEKSNKKEESPQLSLLEQAKRRWKPLSLADREALEKEAKGKWIEQKDSEGTYYYNSVTKVTTRTRPPDFVDRSMDPIVIGTTVWTVNKASNGQLFYTNKDTGESRCQRPGEAVVPAATTTETAESKVAAAATAVTEAGEASFPPGEEPDEIIDLVATTAPSEFVPSDKIYGHVLSESEEGISIIGFNLRLNTPLAKLMEAWADYMEVPVPSVYFEFGDKVLAAMETPSSHGWSLERGPFKIVAKPCEEIECEDSEAEEEEAKKQLAKEKILLEYKQERKKRRKESRAPA